jgi:peptide/nickel transport system ATP-binding protein
VLELARFSYYIQRLNMKTDQTLLEVRGLTTRIQSAKGPIAVVCDLSFDLIAGKTTAIVGESGCGKSMTALSLMRILPSPPAFPSEGEVWYRKQNLLTLSEREMRKIRGKNIAMIFQDPQSALNPVYTVGNQLLEVAELHLGIYDEEAEERVIRSLKEVGISSPEQRMNEYPHQLSGGMKQRVMIAMAMMCEPDILIADEPTTALDVTIQAQVLELMRELQKKKGMALLLITHDMGVVAEMADEVIVMYASRMVEKAGVNDLFDRPAHPYTKGLFASRPSHDSHKGKLQTIKGTVPPLSQLPGGCSFHPRCPFAMEKCRSGNVPEFSLDGIIPHKSACWLHEKEVTANV